jgi:hypothetical protein
MLKPIEQTEGCPLFTVLLYSREPQLSNGQNLAVSVLTLKTSSAYFLSKRTSRPLHESCLRRYLTEYKTASSHLIGRKSGLVAYSPPRIPDSFPVWSEFFFMGLIAHNLSPWRRRLHRLPLERFPCSNVHIDSMCAIGSDPKLFIM